MAPFLPMADMDRARLSTAVDTKRLVLPMVMATWLSMATSLTLISKPLVPFRAIFRASKASTVFKVSMD